MAAHLSSRRRRQPGIGAFMKERRRLIPPNAPALGRYTRLPNRRGKFVTQEEIAEALGISRVWYATLESDCGIRVSARLLARIADTLMLNSPERVRLLGLALPELQAILPKGSPDGNHGASS